MTASRHLLYGETSGMHRFGVILVHSSTQVFKSWRFHGPLLWILIFSESWSSVLSMDFQRNLKQVIGWAILAAFSFVFETNGEFPWLCVWDLKGPPSFHLHDPGRWQQIFVNHVSVNVSIHPSFNVCSSPVPFAEKQPHTMVFPPPNFTGVFRVICRAISPPNMVCILASKQLLSSDHTPSISPAFPSVVQQTRKELQQSLACWACIQPLAVQCITYCFLWDHNTCSFQVFLKLSTSGPWLLDISSDGSFYSSVRNLVTPNIEHLLEANSCWNYNDRLSTSVFWPQHCSLEHSEA